MATTQLPIEGVFDRDTGKMVGFAADSGEAIELDIEKTRVHTDGDVWVTDKVFGGAIGGDWTSAFLSAQVLASATNKRVWVPPGEYAVSDAAFYSNTHIVMAGEKGLSVIKRTTATGSTAYLFNSPIVNLSGLTFDMNKEGVSANQWGVLVNLTGCQFTSIGCTYKKMAGHLALALVL